MQITAEDLRALVGILRVLPDRTQAEMAAAAHLHPTTVGRYEHGETIPDRRTLEKLAAAVPLPMWAIDGLLLPVIAVTGSNGKTTVKEMLASILAAHCGARAPVLAVHPNMIAKTFSVVKGLSHNSAINPSQPLNPS